MQDPKIAEVKFTVNLYVVASEVSRSGTLSPNTSASINDPCVIRKLIGHNVRSPPPPPPPFPPIVILLKKQVTLLRIANSRLFRLFFGGGGGPIIVV